MNQFAGFPANMHFTPLPNIFFNQILPQIDEITELKATLYIFWLINKKRGYPRFASYGEILDDRVLMEGIKDNEALRHGIELAINRGTFIRLNLEKDGRLVELYFLNSENDSAVCNRIRRGELDMGALPVEDPYTEVITKSNIFTLYEENIGMLTPMIAEELKDAELIYPSSWIEEAFKEAVIRNKRHWKYIEAILKRWSSEGKEHGESGGDFKEDRDRYIKGKYGHLVKRRIE